ncbi:hypothetical protein Cantr_01915 [Candida viswanathii]|uniref:Uncharacterized protein n=1 Tax=Candida viswanathii TaxID=5486 RepID=A0A367YMK0_9ASCO|nr:hypothetical protein Cantr_01915 [Candida viswanathii]
MSKIILIPSSLPQEYPDASISTPQRLRILAQVRQYIVHESTIVIDKVPTVTSQHSTPVKVDIFSVLEGCPSRALVPGTVVNIDAFYDGDTINPVEIYEVNGANFTPDNLQLIEEMNNAVGKFD